MMDGWRQHFQETYQTNEETRIGTWQNYRGITLLSTVLKVYESILVGKSRSSKSMH